MKAQLAQASPNAVVFITRYEYQPILFHAPQIQLENRTALFSNFWYPTA